MADQLSSDEILKAEFNYIANTAFQANEDRARVASFYVVTFGSFIAALVSGQFDVKSEQQNWVYWGFFGLFMALALMGLLTVIQLARLRLAWFDSVDAMNRIKEYYIAHSSDLADAFKWRNAQKPQKLKLNSVGFLLVLQVAILGGAAFGTGVFFAFRAISENVSLLPAILAGVMFCLGQFELYRFSLK
jgi:hypothetical protein